MADITCRVLIIGHKMAFRW